MYSVAGVLVHRVAGVQVYSVTGEHVYSVSGVQGPLVWRFLHEPEETAALGDTNGSPHPASSGCCVFDRPGVAGAVLQTAS